MVGCRTVYALPVGAEFDVEGRCKGYTRTIWEKGFKFEELINPLVIGCLS